MKDAIQPILNPISIEIKSMFFFNDSMSSLENEGAARHILKVREKILKLGNSMQ